MNRDETKQFVEKNSIATLRVDKTDSSPEGDELLVHLGNKNKQIPFIAIFPAGKPTEPIVLDGVFTSPAPVLEALRRAVPSGVDGRDLESQPPTTAMRDASTRE